MKNKNLIFIILLLLITLTGTAQDSWFNGFEPFNNYSDFVKEGLIQPNLTTSLGVNQVHEGVRVFPNPFIDYFYVENLTDNNVIQLYDVSGKRLTHREKGKMIIPGPADIIILMVNDSYFKLQTK